jgi:hypothetical protein
VKRLRETDAITCLRKVFQPWPVEVKSKTGGISDDAWETWGRDRDRRARGEAGRRGAGGSEAACIARRPPVARRGEARAASPTMVAHPARQAHHLRWRRSSGLRRLALPVAYGPAIGHVPFGTPVRVDGREVTSSPPPLLRARSTSRTPGRGAPARDHERRPADRCAGARTALGEPALLALAKQLSFVTGPFRPPPAFIS